MSQRRPNFFDRHPASFNATRDGGRSRGYCEHVDDGDSYDFWIDVGYGAYVWKTIRLRDFDTPEIHRGPGITKAEIEHGLRAKARVKELIESKHVIVRSYINTADKEDITLARYEADVWYYVANRGWMLLRETLAAEGYAKRTDYPADA